jgi:hypothetical protein
MAMTKRTTWKPNAQWKLSAMEQGASLDGKQVVAMFKNAPDKEWRAHLDAVVNKKA